MISRWRHQKEKILTFFSNVHWSVHGNDGAHAFVQGQLNNKIRETKVKPNPKH
jgi:hypothetical protein